MAEPSWSVIIPTHNRCEFIGAAIESVLAQSEGDLEVIVVDDGSTDHTGDVVRAVPDTRVKLLQQANAGISAARNAGAGSASGRWLAFLDDDDRMHPRYLERFRQVLEASGCVAATCGARLRTRDGRSIGSRRPASTSPAFDGVVAWFTSGTLVLEREVFVEIGGYLDGLQCSHQTELAFRLLDWCGASGTCIAAVDELLVDLERAAPHERGEASPIKLLTGTELVLERHADRFRRDPELRADFHAIAGVAAMRLGRRADARRHFWAAARAQPSDPRQVARAVISFIAPIADRVWRRSRYANSNSVSG